MIADKKFDKEYLPITGLADFNKASMKLAYGDLNLDGKVAVTQSLSGTGALRIGGEFLNKWYKTKKIYLPTPRYFYP